MTRIQVVVSLKEVEPIGDRPLFKRVVDVEEIDGNTLSSLIPALRFLFSDNAIIQFIISYY